LLDFSLRIETFYQHLWPVEGIRQYLTRRYRHLIIDNLEEDNPFAHTILRDWLASTESALLINDEDAGYRIFLGANWRTAQKLADLADETLRFTESQIASPDMLALGNQLEQILLPQRPSEAAKEQNAAPSKPKNRKSKLQNPKSPDPRRVITFQQERFYPQMITWVIDRIQALLAEGVPPEEIVVLAPFVSDALRFSFIQRMAQRGLPARSHRPSRPLSEEPAAKTVLTLARLAFADMDLPPEPSDVAQALSQAIADLDLIRADLLTQVVYRPSTTADRRPLTADQQQSIQSQRPPMGNSQLPLTPFDPIEGSVRERISPQVGSRFDTLRSWLQAVKNESPEGMPLDHFLSRLFDELLAQPGFGFHEQPEAGEVIANLIDSARKFRQVAEQVPNTQDTNGAKAPELPRVHELNRAYLETINQEIMAAQYMRSWDAAPEAAVLITPATTFLISNRPVDYQFWLDAGSSGWWENIAQPLTHPYILTPDWEPGRPWTDADEIASQRDRLYRLVLGLTRRCRKHIFIANAEIGEQGYEQRGQLLIALQQMLRRLQENPSE
jgi:hypothetical protein